MIYFPSTIIPHPKDVEERAPFMVRTEVRKEYLCFYVHCLETSVEQSFTVGTITSNLGQIAVSSR
jgi:hypothetical protein